MDREAFESSSAVLQTAATPFQLPVQFQGDTGHSGRDTRSDEKFTVFGVWASYRSGFSIVVDCVINVRDWFGVGKPGAQKGPPVFIRRAFLNSLPERAWDARWQELVPGQRSAALVLSHPCLEEILLLREVDRFTHPWERVG